MYLRHTLYCITVNIVVFSWPKKYLDIVMRTHTVVLTQENISKFMMRNNDFHVMRCFEYRDEENPHTVVSRIDLV
jgi:hypothetical protein